MNSIIMSIRPEWAVKILNGTKTIEVRKSVPHEVLEWLKDTSKPFPEITYFMYVTKDNKLQWVNGCLPIRWGQGDRNERLMDKTLNGKVAGKFTLKKVERNSKFTPVWEHHLDKSLLSSYEWVKYAWDHLLADKFIYLLYISDLVVFDKPKELSEFHKVGFNEAMKNWEWDRLSPPDEKSILIPCPAPRYAITKAPQSWCKVEEKQDE